LVDGATARVVRLRAYGNAINAKAAQAFIECLM
jgi:DNA (cytosine-5)-methyltransferase 1